MAKKRITQKQIQELSEMIKAGKTNADVAKYFGISIATVNNHRTRLKRKGVNLPSKRGRKPKSASAASASSDKQIKRVEAQVNIENYIFIVNGVHITISGKAKNVHIGRTSMIVNF